VIDGWDGYAERWSALHGGYDPRRASPLVRGWLRLAHRIARVLARVRVRPSAVTAAGVVVAAAVPAVVGFRPTGGAVAAALVVLGALADSVDGALAVVTGTESRLGRVYDSVADRLSEAAWLLALYLLGAPGWLAAGCLAVTWLHEYVRARATVAGMSEIGAVTVGERPTRVLVALFGLAAAGFAGLLDPDLAPGTATVAVAAWAALGALGILQLAAAVRRVLS
jgi:CDP-diacylglycerol--glycerol-3-phosphate 3-phosphatidyltransferase